MLEINPNGGIFYSLEEPGSADLILMNDPARHRGFLDHLLRCALRRAAAARPTPSARPSALALEG